MGASIRFISGLPRAGSTLLSALLRQNPAVRAGIVSFIDSLVAVAILLREEHVVPASTGWRRRFSRVCLTA